MEEHPATLSKRRAAKYLGIGVLELDEKISTGKIGYTTSGTRKRFWIRELDRFLADEAAESRARAAAGL